MNDKSVREYASKQSAVIGIPEPKIILSKRFSSSLGEACLQLHVIKLNQTFIHKTTDLYAESLILHELIHLKNWIENQSQWHDKKFRQMCKKYGCHSACVFTTKEKKKLKERALRIKPKGSPTKKIIYRFKAPKGNKP